MLLFFHFHQPTIISLFVFAQPTCMPGVSSKLRREVELAARMLANEAQSSGRAAAGTGVTAAAATSDSHLTDLDLVEAACRCWLCERWVVMDFVFTPGVSSMPDKFDPVSLYMLRARARACMEGSGVEGGALYVWMCRCCCRVVDCTPAQAYVHVCRARRTCFFVRTRECLSLHKLWSDLSRAHALRLVVP